jgi:hypothetical protein
VSPSLNPVTVTTNFFVTNSACINTGNSAAANVKMTNPITGSATILSVPLSPPGTTAINGNTVISSFGTVTLGGCVTATLNLVPQAAGMLIVNTTAGSDYPDPNTYNNSMGALITVLPLPLLSIKTWPANKVRVSWPEALTNYTLQYKSPLDPSIGWLNDPNSLTLSNNENVVIESRTNATRFYRLRQSVAP